MARPAHTLMTWKGVFGTTQAPQETWQFGLRSMRDVSALPQESRNEIANVLAQVWGTHLAPLHRSHVVLTRAEIRHIGADGRETRDSDGAFSGQGQSPATTAIPGTSSAATIYPPHVAVVASLVTGRAGATGKGRVFLPAPGFLLSAADLRMTQANTDTIRAGFRAFIIAVNEAIGLPVSVVSSKGYASEVIAVKVGRALDTQRSRRRDLQEEYGSSVGVAPVAP